MTNLYLSPIRALFGAISAIVFCGASHGAADCPLIRPLGLTEKKVDAVVTNTVAKVLSRSPDGLDESKTFAALDGTENAILTYTYAAVSIGELLGFDASRAFYDAAIAKGQDQPFDTLTLGELKQLSRAGYERGADLPLPGATEDEVYLVHSIKVRSPSPAKAWRIVQCGVGGVTFQHQTESSLSNASVRAASFPTFTSQADFFLNVSEVLSAAVPADIALQPWQPQPVPGSSAPCADATLVGNGASGSFFLRARFCYEDKKSVLGYAALFSYVSRQTADFPTAQADAFVAFSTPK